MSHTTQRGVLAVFLFVCMLVPTLSQAATDYDRYSLSYFARTNSDSSGTDEFECSYGNHESYDDGEYSSDTHNTCYGFSEDEEEHQPESIFDHYFNLIYQSFEQSNNSQESEYDEVEQESENSDYVSPFAQDIREDIESNPIFDRLHNLF